MDVRVPFTPWIDVFPVKNNKLRWDMLRIVIGVYRGKEL